MNDAAAFKTAPSGARKRLPPGLVALVCIALQFHGILILSTIALILWILMLSKYDRISLARMWIPRFWLITLVFALTSGFLLGPRDIELMGLSFSGYGLEAGGLMIVRGAFIFGLVIWASRNLNFGHLKRLAARMKAERLALAVEVALRLIPVLKDRLGADLTSHKETHKFTRSPRGLYSLLIMAVVNTARLSEKMARGGEKEYAMDAAQALPERTRPVIAAVTGSPATGKTSILAYVVKDLKDGGIEAGGILQLAAFENGEKTGYNLADVASGESRAFARKRKDKLPDGMGYVFDPSGWEWAKKRIDDARRFSDVVVLDELGLLEAEGRGHIPVLLEKIENERARLYLLGVRENCVNEIEQQIGRFDFVLSAATGGERIVKVKEMVNYINGFFFSLKNDVEEDNA